MRILLFLLLLAPPALAQSQDSTAHFDTRLSFAYQKHRADSLERANESLVRQNTSQQVTIGKLSLGDAKRQETQAFVTTVVIIGVIGLFVSTMIKQ